MISTKTGFGSDTDIIFQKQNRIRWWKFTIRSSPLLRQAQAKDGNSGH